MRNLGFEWEGLEWWSHQPKNEQMDLMGSSGIVLGKQGEYHGTYHKQCDLGSFPKGAQQWWLTFFFGGDSIFRQTNFLFFNRKLGPNRVGGSILGLTIQQSGITSEYQSLLHRKGELNCQPNGLWKSTGSVFSHVSPKVQKRSCGSSVQPPRSYSPKLESETLTLWFFNGAIENYPFNANIGWINPPHKVRWTL